MAPKLSNKKLIELFGMKKELKSELRKLQRQSASLEVQIDRKEDIISQVDDVTEIYCGVALTESSFLGSVWTRSDTRFTDSFREGRYWDNAHNPAKGDWNIELRTRTMGVAGWNDKVHFFKFTFGTREECRTACKEWAAFGKLPPKEKS